VVAQEEMGVEVQDRMLEWRGDGKAESWRQGARRSVGPEGHDYTRTPVDRADLDSLGVDITEVRNYYCYVLVVHVTCICELDASERKVFVKERG